jgi:hypothetical protein
MKQMFCWVTKYHEKKLTDAFAKTHKLIFTETLDELFSHRNCITIVSLSKVTNQTILRKIKDLHNPYFLEKKGWITFNMTEALASSENHFMIGMSDIYVITSCSMSDDTPDIPDRVPLKEIGTVCEKDDGWGMIIEIHSDDHGILFDKNNPANRAVIYLNPHINKPDFIDEVKREFGLSHNIPDVRVKNDGSDHYRCFLDFL